tara:strand:+ start:138 stop:398 length:261 start_codon:yes stop_codon:yes gene_type:complete
MIENLGHIRKNIDLAGQIFEIRSLTAGEIAKMLDLPEGIKQQSRFLSACVVEPRLSEAEAECLPFPVFSELMKEAMILNGLSAEGE